MNDLSFAQALWFWGALVLLPLFALRLRAHLRAGRHLPGLVSPRLSHRLIKGANPSRRWIVFFLQCLALLCLLTALARPRMGFEEVKTEIDARNLLIAIDTSRSMMADDLPPNRLARARLAAKDIILSLPDDRIGLIAFAGKPFLQAPLTVDHEAVLESIDQLDTEIIPRGGTNLSAAVNLAIETIREAKIGLGALVLFSDGEALEGVAELERMRDQAAEAGLFLVSVGVGTADGSIIPEVDDSGKIIPGAFVKDEKGHVVRTRLTPEPLQTLAGRKGSYLHLGGAASLNRVVGQIREGLSHSREEGETTRRPIERFVWPLSAAFFLFVLSHLLPLFWRKPVAVRSSFVGSKKALAILVLFPGVSTSRSAADPLRQGLEAYTRKDYADAAAAYERILGDTLPKRAQNRARMGLGAAAYRLGNFEQAAEAYGSVLANGDEELGGEAHYNLGNTLFRRGEAALSPGPQSPRDPDTPQVASTSADAMERAKTDWNGAIEHFESSLAIDPDNDKTRHNLEFVRKRLEELKQQEQEQEKKQQNQQKQDSPQQNPPKDEPPKDEPPKEDPKSGDSKDSPSDGEQDPQKDQPPKSPPPSQGENKPEEAKDSSPPDSPDKEKPDSSSEEGKPDQPSPNPGEPGSENREKPDSPKNPGSQTPQEPENPQDGKLEANPNQTQPEQPQDGRNAQAPQGEASPNPLTGYSPTEARQLLDALNDETEVRPVLKPARGETFKNW